MKYQQQPHSHCDFGISRCDITPAVGIYHRMWGAASHDRSEGVHRPLLATVAVFRNSLHASQANGTGSADLQVLMALDHCLLGRVELDRVLQRVTEATGLPQDCLLTIFSHTHAAGLMTLDRSELPGGEGISAYLDHVADSLATLTTEAVSGLKPATISYAEGRCQLAAHRDFWDEETQEFVCGFNPGHPADDLVSVARVTDADGELRATFVNYACHPTTLAWDNRLISPDFPGAMRETVEQATGGAICMFIQGASGDLGPREGFIGDVAVADRNGRQLGYAALEALHKMDPPDTRFAYAGPVVSGATIGTWEHREIPENDRRSLDCWSTHRGQLPLAYRPELPTAGEVQQEREQLLDQERQAKRDGQLARSSELRAMAERKSRLHARLDSLPPGDSFPLQMAAWRMGDAVWLAVQGEPYNWLQQELRHRFSDRTVIVAAIAGHWGCAYLPPRDAYGKGIYQEKVAVLAAGCLEQVVDEAQRIVESLFS